MELTKIYCPDTPFIFMSTNKVYGDNPNKLPLLEKSTRWEIKNSHKFKNGIDETIINNSQDKKIDLIKFFIFKYLL